MLRSERDFDSPQRSNNAHAFFYWHGPRHCASDPIPYRRGIGPRYRMLSPSTFSLARRLPTSIVSLCLPFLLQHVERNIQLVPHRCRLFTVHMELNWPVRIVSQIGVSQLPVMILAFLHIAFVAFNLDSTSQTRIFPYRSVA
jgi:hypothetical protein